MFQKRKFSCSPWLLEESGPLTDEQIAKLAQAVDSHTMKTIALIYLGLDDAFLRTLEERESSPETFKRHILHTWAHKNPEDQIQVWYNAGADPVDVRGSKCQTFTLENPSGFVAG